MLFSKHEIWQFKNYNLTCAEKLTHSRPFGKFTFHIWGARLTCWCAHCLRVPLRHLNFVVICQDVPHQSSQCCCSNDCSGQGQGPRVLKGFKWSHAGSIPRLLDEKNVQVMLLKDAGSVVGVSNWRALLLSWLGKEQCDNWKFRQVTVVVVKV